MSGSNGTLPLHVQSIDCLFGLLGGRPPENGSRTTNFIVSGHPRTPPLPQRPEQLERVPKDWPRLPTSLEQSPEGRAAFEWLQNERKRLEEYTHAQFAIIQQRHQTLMAAKFRNEEALALDTQKLNQDFQM